ncbi:MAG: hypothetical protein MJE63_34200 [Proteobacteria bacterium]|nr:hypothetical protein [Pseudomonadota bacterium]
MLLKGPAQQLADLMIKLSQKYHNQEWAFGLEFELWREVVEEQDILTDDEINKLDEMSKWCKGWITMAFKDGEEGLEFLLLEDWEEKYQKEKPF